MIEDEPLAADRLIGLIREVDSSVEVVDQFDTIRDTVSFLKETGSNPDLLFCDIQLADGLSFEIFNQIDTSLPVIFTTAYDAYALKAFEVHSVDYLLKPIKPDALKRAIARYQQRFERHPDASEMKRLLDYFRQGAPVRKRFLVKAGNKYYHKTIDEISYFAVESKVVFLYDLPEGKKFPTDFNLDELMANHLSRENYFRINRKVIINIEAVEVIKPYFNQRLSVKLKVPHASELIVSRAKVKAFKAWFNG